MLSTIVFTQLAPAPAPPGLGALLRTLAALVPATMDGIVRDVTLLHVGQNHDVEGIADEAGCQFVEEGDFPAALARSVAGTRSPWIFLVKAGTVPSRLFGEEALRALSDVPGEQGAILLRETPKGLARWFPSLAPVAGVILHRGRLADGEWASFAEILRHARPARTLPTAAFS